MAEKDPPETLELKYIDGAGVRASYASGVVLSKVPGDLFQLSFYTDVHHLVAETLVLQEIKDPAEFSYKGTGKPARTQPAREIQARILIAAETLRQFARLLNENIDKVDDDVAQ